MRTGAAIPGLGPTAAREEHVRNGPRAAFAQPAMLQWCALALAALAPLAPPSPALATADAGAVAAPYLIVEREDGEPILRISLGSSPRWIVRWNHSVTGIEVSDYYVYENHSMLLEKTHTPAFDAGLGHIPGRGRLVSDGHGGYWIHDIDEPVPGNAYRLRVGSPLVDHRIVHASGTWSLSALAAGRRVVIRVAEAPSR